MNRPSHSDPPPRLVLDFNEPMRPKPRGRVKIIAAREKPPSGGTLAFPNRPELYELLGLRPGKEPR